MRGAVTLAAVFVLPEDTPHREVLILIALVVAAGTLLIQGSTLPWLVRRLGLRGPDPAQDLLLQARVQQDAAAAGIAALDEVADRRRATGRRRAAPRSAASTGPTPRGSGSAAPTRRRARCTRGCGRTCSRPSAPRCSQARDEGTAPDDVLQRVLDVPRHRGDDPDPGGRLGLARNARLISCRGQHESGCEHLAAAADAEPRTSDAAGMRGVPAHRPAVGAPAPVPRPAATSAAATPRSASTPTAHFHETGHPVMRSFEPGEAWRWCYVDEVLG